MSIKTLEGGQIENFKSINAAKKKSRKLQLEEDRGLGRGSLQVIG
jgi:hypothetical protein